MSFDPNPDLYSYSVAPNICDLCFLVNKTPETVFLNFSGIEIGTGWLPADPDPPNGIFELPIVGPCLYQKVFGPWLYEYDLRFGFSEILITDGGIIQPFSRVWPTTCELWFSNFIQNPLLKYFGGWCIVTPPLPGGVFSEVELLDLVGIDTILQTWANPRPAPADISFHTISRGADATNIKIKFEHT